MGIQRWKFAASGSSTATMNSPKCMLVVVVVLVVLGLTSAMPQSSNCDHWCKDRYGRYTCCSNLHRTCPHDPRPWGSCAHSPIVGGYAEGPERCYSDRDCGSRAICCMDNCLRHKKCTDV